MVYAGVVADVVVDSVSQGDISSYTFNDVVAAHTIAANYTLLSTRTISGTVTAVNEALDAAPEAVNESAEGAGWMAKITIVDESELQNLMTQEQYDEYLKTL